MNWSILLWKEWIKVSYNRDKRIDGEYDPPLPKRNTNLTKEEQEKLEKLLEKYKKINNTARLKYR